jgi:ABC-type bacteriocin/lantibiotic exporter with double-glycine peptidase domain
MPNIWLEIPHFEQEEPLSCVPACTRMILEYYGISIQEAYLRQALAYNSFLGTPAANIARVVNTVAPNLTLEFGTFSLAELIVALASNALPIIFLNTGPLDYWSKSSDHAVVFTGTRSVNNQDLVDLNDPFFTAPQQASLVNFEQAWARTTELAAIIHCK